MLALTLFGIFFAIALAGVPLLYSILITTTGIIALQGLGHPLETIFLSFIGGVEPFILLAVPLFIFAGELMPAVDRVFPLAEAAEAHRRLESRLGFGKIVLAV